MSTAAHRDTDFADAVRAVAETVAGPHADEVDRDARFPHEAIAGLRAHGALSAFVPHSLGGAGVDFGTIATACFDLARACSATGMVYAMHQIQVASIVRHAHGSAFFEGYLQELATGERLIASVTSEVGVGGDLRTSRCEERRSRPCHALPGERRRGRHRRLRGSGRGRREVAGWRDPTASLRFDPGVAQSRRGRSRQQFEAAEQRLPGAGRRRYARD